MTEFRDSALAMVGVIFIVLSISVLIPALIINLESPQETSFEQVEDTRYSITGAVSSRATEIRGSQNEANVTVLDERTGDFGATGTLQAGETATITIDGQPVNVTLITVETDTEALFTYEYPLFLGWPAGSELFVKNITEIVMLSVVVFIAGTLITLSRVFTNA